MSQKTHSLQILHFCKCHRMMPLNLAYDFLILAKKTRFARVRAARGHRLGYCWTPSDTLLVNPIGPVLRGLHPDSPLPIHYKKGWSNQEI